MEITGAVALVTGASRGFGRHLVEQLLERGAARVYAAARDPAAVTTPRAVPLALDVTDPEAVARAAAAAPDVTLLVNNAGVSLHADLLESPMERIRAEVETNLFGMLAVTRAFAPVIAARGGGAMLNVLSALSWRHLPHYGAYSVAKAAGWAMSNVVRQELAGRGIAVTTLHVGYMATDMASYVPDDAKADPALVVAAALDGVAAGAPEVVYGRTAQSARRALAAEPAQAYPALDLPPSLVAGV